MGLLVSVDASASTITWIAAGTTDPTTQTLAEFNAHYSGQALLLQPNVEAVRDPDQAEHSAKSFGFRWFVPELLKHRKVWRDVLWASLVLQLLALGMPLFTQAIIDKVVVHQTESTLIVIAMGMAIFMVATAILTWVRQYLVLHTGNRVDAVLASTVFDHLFKLPPRYFQNRPTGVVAATPTVFGALGICLEGLIQCLSKSRELAAHTFSDVLGYFVAAGVEPLFDRGAR